MCSVVASGAESIDPYFAEILQNAEAGDREAQRRAANMYRYGTGVERDLVEAERWEALARDEAMVSSVAESSAQLSRIPEIEGSVKGYQDILFGMTEQQVKSVLRENCDSSSITDQTNGTITQVLAKNCYNIAGAPRDFTVVIQDNSAIQIAVDFVSNILNPPNRSEFRSVVDALGERYEPYTSVYGDIEWHAFADGQVMTYYSQTTNELLGDAGTIPDPSVPLGGAGTITYTDYVLNGTVYEPTNAHDSYVERLDGNHSVAPYGWQVVNGDNEIETYTIDGKLLMLTAPSGLSHYMVYDAVDGIKLVEVQDDFGHSLFFHYEDVNDPSLLTRITDPDGNDYLLTYTSRDMITSITFPDLTPGDTTDNPSIQYLYQDVRFPDSITDIIDESGNLAEHYEYDDSGRAVLSELAGGVESISVEYDDVANTRTLTNVLGLRTTYHLNGDSLFSYVERQSINTPLVPLQTQNFTYDSFNNLASEIDWNGNTTTFVRDIRGLEISRTEAVGTVHERTITTTWHPTLRLPTQIVEPGRTIDFTYDTNGNLLTRTETDTTNQTIPYSTNGRTRTVTFTYYPEGVTGQFLVATQDGPRTDINDITSFTYTAEGYVETITNPLGHLTQVTSYNSRGLPLTTIDSNNVVTNMTYHPRGWLLTATVIDPSGGGDATTTNDYDDEGLLTRVTLPNGAFLDYEYDAADRLTAISNNLGERQEFTVDGAGNITVENSKNSSGSITRTQSRVYDELSRMIETLGGAGQLARMSYDGNSNQTATVLDPLGLNQNTMQMFDALDRLSQVTDALSNNSSFSYDARDNLISVTDQRGLTTTFIYDGLNNLIQQESPDTGITVFVYDDAGNQISKTDSRGVVTNNAFDALNRLTSVSYPSAPAEGIAYTYDQPAGGFAVGRLTQITDQTGSTSFVYDHRGNQVTSTVTIQANTYSTHYAYDLADNLIQTTYPSGRIVNHQLDALGRTQGISTLASAGGSSQNLASNIAYLPFGPMNGLKYGNNLDLVISNDLDYRVTGISVEDVAGQNADVLGLTYTQNAVDNITAIVDSVDANESQTFVYDLLNRLEDATGDYGNQSYTYDGVGNRLSLTRVVGAESSTEVYSYDSNSNRLLSVDKDGVVRTLQYDAAGNIVSDDRGAEQGFTLEYNDQNRLLNVNVTDDTGAPLSGINTYAFDNVTYTGSSAVTDGAGVATYSLVDGDYRFRADANGTQYFSSASNHCTTPACTTINMQIPRAVDVAVASSAGGSEPGLTVYAFDGSTYTNKSAVTNASGVATLQLLDGDYRFRIDKNGTQFFTDDANHCAVPGCTAISYEVPESVTVTVTSGGAPDQGLNVYAFDGSTYVNKSAVTDVNGEAVFTLLPGDYRFRIDKNGTQYFTDSSNHCTTPGCNAVSFDIPAEIAVNVTSSAGGPEAGLTVYAFDGSTYVNKSAVTDSNGVAAFTLLTGNYRFRIDKSGTQFFTDEVNHCSVPGCTSIDYEIPENISVTVTSSGGGFEPGLTVYAFDGSTYVNKSAVTDANGKAIFTLLPGNYRFRIDKNGTQYFTDTTNHCSAPGCNSVSFEIPVSTTVTVTSSAGGFESGLNVYAFDGSTYVNKSAVTNSNGEATFTLLAGDYRFRIDKNGSQFFTDSVNHCTVPGCDAVSYEVPEDVLVTVTSSAGGSEAGLTVYAFDNTTYVNKSAVTDANGEASFTLLPGDYRFRIDKNGTQFFTDDINHCTTPGCNAVSYEVPAGVTVNVSNTLGDPESGLTVYAFDDAVYANKSSVTDASGNASFTLLPGNYRFRTDKGGTQFFSSPVNHCAVPGCTLITQELPASLSAFVVDPALGACLDAAGSANGWTAPAEVTSLSCNSAGVTNLSGLQSFSNLASLSLADNPITLLGALDSLTNLTSLDLTGTTMLECAQLSSLEAALGAGVISQPAICLGEGELVFSVANPNQVDTNQFSFDVATTPAGDIVSSAITFNPGTSSFDGRVFLIDGTSGNELLELQNPAPSGSDYFGWSVATTSGGNILVGAWQDDVGGVSAGVVYLFSGADGSLLQTINNPNPTADDRFGYDVEVTANGTIVIGAYQEAGGGAVYLYDQQGVLQQSVFSASGDANAEFGKSVSSNASSEILVGAPKQDVVDGVLVTDAGVVYMYPESGGSPLLQIDNPQPQVNDDFGSAVAVVNGGDIIVSARLVDNFANNDGSVFIHDGVTGNVLWSVANPIADVEGLFGSSIAGSPQGHVVVGSANDDTGDSNSGKVFVFDGLVGDLIQVIDNPTSGPNFNFGQGLDVTPAGQIAVGAFGADGGFGTLHLFTSVSAGTPLDLLNEQPFGDVNLQSCVLGEAASNGWATVDEVTSLNCANRDIVDLTGVEALDDLTSLDLSDNDITDVTALESLTNLMSLDLTGNNQILCADLDDLEAALGAGVVIRPVPCNTGGGILPQPVQNLHNAQGQRAVKTVNSDPSTAIHFIYDQRGQVIAEIDASTGQTLREYVYVNGMQIALVDDTGTPEEATYFVHNDHLNTPQKITDDSQAVVWAASYDPFGEVTETVSTIENNIRFPGQYADGESGLHYNYFRDYDPSLGRYVESDPIGIIVGKAPESVWSQVRNQQDVFGNLNEWSKNYKLPKRCPESKLLSEKLALNPY
ncbi:wapA [Symbiodinium microadriaticum]|nr:wapA [Symbiodinium microadriaticum]